MELEVGLALEIRKNGLGFVPVVSLVLVLSLSYLGLVFVLSSSCFGFVLVLSWACLGLVLVGWNCLFLVTCCDGILRSSGWGS